MGREVAEEPGHITCTKCKCKLLLFLLFSFYPWGENEFASVLPAINLIKDILKNHSLDLIRSSDFYKNRFLGEGCQTNFA